MTNTFRNTLLASLAIAAGLMVVNANAKNFSQHNNFFKASKAQVKQICLKNNLPFQVKANGYYSCDGAEFICGGGTCRGYETPSTIGRAIEDNPSSGEGDGGGGR